jgi:hypothetical protein
MAGRLIRMVLLAQFIFATLIDVVTASDPAIIVVQGANGRAVQVANDRIPTLYTGDFSDCLGGESLFNITKFDTGYYSDNMTVVVHMDGSTNLISESLMLHLSVQAYGDTRFEMSIDPCAYNISSLCPVDSVSPVTAWMGLNVTAEQVHNITSISLDVPDFEGAATLRIFANSSQTEIGCMQAVLKNGRTFSHPKVIVPILGVLTLVAIISSFVTAMYGFSIVHVRQHHAHALPVLVVFETFQSIFFSGALSVSWPSVLPSWWTNFAWSAGMMHNGHLVDSMRSFAGIQGNGSQAGGAGSAVLVPGGGLIRKIYGRAFELEQGHLSRRAHVAYDESDPWDYAWAGNPATPGMPTPGTYPGFSGTLEPLDIPERDAFLVGLVWLAVTVAAVAALVVVTKFILDLLVWTRVLKTEGFNYFRTHLPGFVAIAVLRTLFIAFFTVITLALLQFNIKGPAGPTAIAAIVFVVFLVGMGGVVGYACHARLHEGHWKIERNWLRFERSQLFGSSIPFVVARRVNSVGEKETTIPSLGHIRFFRIRYTDNDVERARVHDDMAYIKRFGWLSAHYRRSRWWFFGLWLGYQFVRACFLGGGANNPLAQVFGLFIFEVLSFGLFLNLNPLEGRRNTTLAIWMLFVSRIITTGLSIAFLPHFAVGRIAATIIGIIIIVVQGFLAFVVLVLILIGCASSCLSLTRNREEFPRALDGVRISYFEHIAHAALDESSRSPATAAAAITTTVVSTASAAPTTDDSTVALTSQSASSPLDPPNAPFRVHSVRRTPKIGDGQSFDINASGTENDDNGASTESTHAASAILLPGVNRSRANSASSYRSTGSNLARNQRSHAQRPSWTSKELSQWDAEARSESPVPIAAAGAILSKGQVQSRSRSNSLRMQATLRAQQAASPSSAHPIWSMTSVDSPPGLRRVMTPGELLATAAARLAESPIKIEEEDQETSLLPSDAKSRAINDTGNMPPAAAGVVSLTEQKNDASTTMSGGSTMTINRPGDNDEVRAAPAPSPRPVLHVQTSLPPTTSNPASTSHEETGMPPSPLSDTARPSHEASTPSPVSPTSPGPNHG